MSRSYCIMSRFGIGLAWCEAVTLTPRFLLPSGEGEEAEQEQLSAFSIQLEPETRTVDVGAVMNSSKITFVSDRDGTFDLFVMDEDGSNQTNITRTPDWEEDHPRWSPDGRWIAFKSDRDGDTQVYMMKADGSDARRLTNLEKGVGEVSWSPTGHQIVFTGHEDGRQQIYRIDVDGGNLVNLSNSPANDFAPDWGPSINT